MTKMKKKDYLIFIRKCFHLRDFTKKSFQNPLVLYSRPFGKLKKFPDEGLFPFDRFPFYDYVLYLLSNTGEVLRKFFDNSSQGNLRICKFPVIRKYL